jgi:hypothetical protein
VWDNGDRFDPSVVERVRSEVTMRAELLSEIPGREDAGPQEQYRALRIRVLQAERTALLDARTTGSYSSRAIERAQRLLDLEESRLGASADEPEHL